MSSMDAVEHAESATRMFISANVLHVAYAGTNDSTDASTDAITTAGAYTSADAYVASSSVGSVGTSRVTRSL